MSNNVRNFDVKNYYNRTTIPQLIANNMSGCFLKYGVFSSEFCLAQSSSAFVSCRENSYVKYRHHFSGGSL